ncbi:penicillin-binding protein 2, partial [Xanthomonas perforans]
GGGGGEGGGSAPGAGARPPRNISDAGLGGKTPAGLEPLDSELGMTAVGVNQFEAGVTDARAAGDAAAATLDELPVVIGQSAVALDPNTPAQPVVPDVPDAVQETDH